MSEKKWNFSVDMADEYADETCLTLWTEDDEGVATIMEVLYGEVAEYLVAILSDNAALKRMVVDAHEACYSEYMECPWCNGHIGYEAERHDENCPWSALLESSHE
jgi:hypothetical protein